VGGVGTIRIAGRERRRSSHLVSEGLPLRNRSGSDREQREEENPRRV
jgi:hypothetical protein